MRIARIAPIAMAMQLAIFAAAMLSVHEASAQDTIAADVLFDEGRKLMAERRLDEACRKLNESHRLDPGIGVALYLGECYALAGKRASAWSAFREAAALARNVKDPREKVATDRAATLEPQLHKVTINIDPPSRVTGLVVTRNGAIVVEPLWGVEVPVDAGKYTIVATAPNKKPWTKTIDVPDAGGKMAITVPALSADDPAPPPPPLTPQAPPRSDNNNDASDKKPSSSRRVVGVAVAGAGVVGLGIGTIMALRALSLRDEAGSHCDGTVCDSPEALKKREDARSAASVATIGFVAGTALLVGGAVLYFTAPSTAKTSGARLRVFVMGTGGVGLDGRF